MDAFESYLSYFPLTEEDLQKSLLDVGAGSGEFVQYVRKQFGNTHAIGIDNELQHFNSIEAGLFVGNGLSLPFENESFEIVLAKHYISIFFDDESEWKQAIKELIRVTKRGGKIMFDYGSSSENEYAIIIEDLQLKGHTVDTIQRVGSRTMIIKKR